MRLDLLERIRRIVKGRWGKCDVHSFGSFAAGIYLPDADMDVVVISEEFSRGRPRLNSSNTIYQMANYVLKEGLAAEGSIEPIVKAKVPLLKFVDRKTSLRVDMSFENFTGIVANSTFAGWKAQFPAMPIIVTVIKQFLLMRGLNEVVNGGIGGFSVTCLVVSLLQNLPRIQSRDLQPEQHLGEMLLEFLDLYGNQFDLANTAISMNPPRYVSKVCF
jgi:non-canonical poly(A) RNA polymerase PAPD5/7